MEDKTPIYILYIVGIVAVVGIVYMLVHVGGGTSVNTATTSADSGSGITANVVADTGLNATSIDVGAIAKVFLGIMLIGTCVYLYFKI